MAGTGWDDSRPLSPHLQVWRWHWTMAASIMHRATGIGLYAGSLVLTAWLVSAAMGPAAYATVTSLMASIPGQALLFLWTLAVAYHFANGIRHLLWDGPGIGFSPGVASAVSVFNFIFAVAVAVGQWALAYTLG